MTDLLDEILLYHPLLLIECGAVAFVSYICLHLIEYFYKKYVRKTKKYILLVLKIAIKITKWFFILSFSLLATGLIYYFYLIGTEKPKL